MSSIIQTIQSIPNPNIVITTHHKPDGDAMGSSLGLYRILTQLGLPCQVITPTDYAPFLHWLPGNSTVLVYTENPERAAQCIENANVIFLLDFNKLARINELGPLVAKQDALKIVIDHHQEPDPLGNLEWWDPKACSTCELIYRFAEQEDLLNQLDSDAAHCLYTGILTDTGGFKHRGTNAQTHLIAAALINKGVEPSNVHAKVLDSFSENRLRLIGYALSEKLEVFPEYHTALISLSAEDLQRFNVQTGDTEGLVNYGLAIQGVHFAALIIDRSVLVKMSFRSHGAFNVNEFAKKHFNGGGHVNAAGGSSQLSLEETLTQFKALLPQYSQELS